METRSPETPDERSISSRRNFRASAILMFYIAGVIATAWHLAYGFWLFAVDWGIVIGEKAQRITLYGSIGLAIFLSAVGINAAVAFVEPCGLFPESFCEAAEQKKIIEPSERREEVLVSDARVEFEFCVSSWRFELVRDVTANVSKGSQLKRGTRSTLNNSFMAQLD